MALGGTLIILPARGEHETLSRVIDAIPAEVRADVAVLDGGGNGRPRWRRPGVEVVPVQAGNGRAVRAGLGLAVHHGYERIVRLDGDGQHDPRVVPALLRALPGADMVLGTRFDPGADLQAVPLDRLLLNVALRDLVATLTGVALHDVVTGCWALQRGAAGLLHEALTTVEYGATLEMVLRLLSAGRAVSQVPIPITYGGSRRMRAKYRPEALRERNVRAAEYFTVLSTVTADLGIDLDCVSGVLRG